MPEETVDPYEPTDRDDAEAVELRRYQRDVGSLSRIYEAIAEMTFNADDKVLAHPEVVDHGLVLAETLVARLRAAVAGR